MGWIDYKKAYDMIPDSMILKSLGLEKCLGILWNLSNNQRKTGIQTWHHLENISGRQIVTIVICDWHDTSYPDIEIKQNQGIP